MSLVNEEQNLSPESGKDCRQPETCAFNSAPRGANFAEHCGAPVAVVLREQRGQKWLEATGQDFQEHFACLDCATDLLTSPRFSILRHVGPYEASEQFAPDIDDGGVETLGL